MGLFPGFGSWINQNTQQQPAETESEKFNKARAKKNEYVDLEELKKQHKLWSDAERKHPWYDAPPKVKVTMKKGVCHMNIELTFGNSPDGVYEVLANVMNAPLYDMSNDLNSKQLLENRTRKVLKEDGPREISEVEKAVACKFLWWSGAVPITLIVDENKKDLTGKYKKEKMMFMKVFEGSYKVEPIYVDAKRLCKHIEPKTQEEYKKCSGGQGKVASKVTMNQSFQPYPPFNLPPLSWYIRGITINTTTTILKMLQNKVIVFREIPF